MKVFTLNQVLNLLLSLQMGLTPHLFKNAKRIDESDYEQISLTLAAELGIKKEFLEFLKNHPKVIKK